MSQGTMVTEAGRKEFVAMETSNRTGVAANYEAYGRARP